MDSFYEPGAPGIYRSSVATTGPWGAGLQHGGPPAALLGRTLNAIGSESGLRVARIAFDFFGPVPVADLSLETEVLRRGRRIQLSTASLRTGDRTVMRATAWHILAEPGRSVPVESGLAVPALPASETVALFPGTGRFPYGDAIEWRCVDGGFDQLGPGTVWARPRIPVVLHTELTGLERTLVVVDAANGISAVLPADQWTFVPVELTVSMERHAQGEWVGMSSTSTIGRDGIGITETRLFDGQGVFGRALQTLYVERR